MKVRSRSFSTPPKRSSSAGRSKATEKWTKAAVLRELQRLADPKVRAKLAYFGINVSKARGISTPVLHVLARRIGKDQELAEQLWSSGIHEAKSLATLIGESEKITAAQMERWVRGFDSWDVVDGACCYLYAAAKPAWKKVYEWSGRRAEFEKLREILLDSGLTEELKWGQPCYALDGKNVALIHGFKEYCALLFMKGALLKDPKGILVQQTKNVQAARQIRFASLADIKKQKATVKAYIREGIAVEKSGLKVGMKSVAQFGVPIEFQTRLDDDPKLTEAFKALTPGRQKGYLLHFAGAKQSATRTARVEKQAPRILKGLGLDD